MFAEQIKKTAATSVAMMCLICMTLLGASFANAAMDTAYIVANDASFAQISGLRGYFADAGHNVVQIKPDQLNELKGKECFIIVGAPKDADGISKLIAKVLTPEQLSQMKKMGNSELVDTQYDGSKVVVFATDYSMKTYVGGTANKWREIFEDWYGIPMNITQIIGY